MSCGNNGNDVRTSVLCDGVGCVYEERTSFASLSTPTRLAATCRKRLHRYPDQARISD